MKTGTPALGEGHPVSLEMNHFCWGNCLGTFHSCLHAIWDLVTPPHCLHFNQFKDLIEDSGYADSKTIVVKFR